MRGVCTLLLLLCGSTCLLASAIPKEEILGAVRDFQHSTHDAGDFTHQASLDVHGRFNLLWKFDSETITFEAHAQTTGYIGLGLSPNGGMEGSDVIIGWVKDGQPFITPYVAPSDHCDCRAISGPGRDPESLQPRLKLNAGPGPFAEGYFEPRLDAHQDVELLSGYENGTHTVIRFRRRLRPCDTAEDREITEDTQRVIWSFNDLDPVDHGHVGQNGPHVLYHGRNRGTKSIILLQKNPPSLDIQDSNIQTMELTSANVLVPAKETTYWCNTMRLPTLDRKHHLVKIEPIIQPGHESLVHHIAVYQCKLGQVPPLLDGGHECNHPNMPEEWNNCKSIITAWAIGGKGFTYPDHVGFSLGTDDDPDYLMMEIHYDNPDRISGERDSSGLKFYYTPIVRQYDAGVLDVGVNPQPTHVIPPGVESFDTTGFCFGLDPHLQELGQPIKVFASMPHSHLAGAAIRTKLVRNGVMQSYVGRDETYDFDLQEIRLLDPEVVVKEGDQLITKCTYKTTDRTQVTIGGLSTRQEMCLNFIQYYPRIKLGTCQTALDINQQATFFAVHYAGWEYPFPIYYPANMVNQTVIDVINQHPWTNEEAERFEQHVRNGQVMPFNRPAGANDGQLRDPPPDPTVPDDNSLSIPGTKIAAGVTTQDSRLFCKNKDLHAIPDPDYGTTRAMRGVCTLLLLLCGSTCLLASAIPKEEILGAVRDFQHSSHAIQHWLPLHG
ncbi:MOXD1 [Branchiostoma lanceolatum]|uniref:MOXD1 protein n=1 Tax=Branchiostoma lanceolatum TaxID=7740 RepID=A0A8J9VZ25_BRALA|nr:MOXD1 [Branchiostoma lanceolatum]